MEDVPSETLSSRTVAVIVNERSRRGSDWFDPVLNELTRRGWTIERAVLARHPGEAETALKSAVDAGVPLIALGGGDGTFTHALGHFVGRQTVMGVLPLGTGNAFARDLGIPSTVAGAVDTLDCGRIGTVDVGKVGADRFLNIVTVGLTTRIAEYLTPDAKRRYGRAVYLVALARAVALTRPFLCEITTAEGHFAFDSLQVVIGNGRYHAGPFPVHPDASITEGRLHMYALKGRNKANFVRLAWSLRLGQQVDMDDVFSCETVGGRLVTLPSKRVTVDGEILYRTPIDFGIEPDSLRVMVPTDFAD